MKLQLPKVISKDLARQVIEALFDKGFEFIDDDESRVDKEKAIKDTLAILFSDD